MWRPARPEAVQRPSGGRSGVDRGSNAADRGSTGGGPGVDRGSTAADRAPDGRGQREKGFAGSTLSAISLPFGAVYDAESPTLRPRIAEPSGLFSEYTSRSVSPATSRFPSRNVISSPSRSTVTTMPERMLPSVLVGASPTWALSRS